jgi:hypothetical protein
MTSANQTIQFQGIKFGTAGEAIQWANASGKGVAILLDGPKVVDQEDADRLEATGVEFAYLCDHQMPDGTHRIVTIPVGD